MHETSIALKIAYLEEHQKLAHLHNNSCGSNFHCD